MTRRNRFDIELPPETNEAGQGKAAKADVPPAQTSALAKGSGSKNRKGPMASAVSEAASSVRSREEMEAQIRAENDALAHEYVALRKEGLIVERVALTQIDASALVRDREEGEDAELEELKASIREIGLSNPIRVAKGEGGRFELIQGSRRLQAFRALNAAYPGKGFDSIPAGIVDPNQSLDENYRRMVDENLVRKDISFAEMGALARAFAADPATSATTSDDAVAVLFKSASYQKRSYIRSFARLMELIGEDLTEPRGLSRNLGLAVLKRLEDDPGTQAALRKALRRAGTIEEELAALNSFAAAGQGRANSEGSPAKSRARAKTTLRLELGEREVKCIAGSKRLELSGETDFSAYERDRLERAVKAFFAALGEEDALELDDVHSGE